MERGDIWWAQLPDPVASEPGSRRRLVIVQSNAFNRSRIRTVIAAVVTSNLRLAEAPGNVLLASGATGLPKDSVANVSQTLTIDKGTLTDRVGKLSKRQFDAILSGIDVMLGR
jgi:mRNA interferase MazF